MTTLEGHRDGATFDPALDTARLNRQAQAVFNAMTDAEWHTLNELAHMTGAPEASVSARLRDLRKRRFGGHTIARRRLIGGTWQYRMTPYCHHCHNDPPTGHTCPRCGRATDSLFTYP